MSIKLKGSSDGSVSFDAPADTSPSGSDITLTLPTSAGSANQFLKNSGIAGELEYSSTVEDSSGRLLIGTTSSTGSHILEVNGGTDNEPIKVESSDAGAYVRFEDNDTTGSTRIGAVDDDFKIDVNSSERLRISSNGNVGINTTSSSNKLRIHEGSDTPNVVIVTGADESSEFLALGISSGVPCVTAGGVSDTDASLAFRTADNGTESERMRITSNGKVQITGTRGGSLQPSDNDTLELFTSASNGNANTGCGLTFYNNDGNGAEIGGTIQVAKENGNINNTAGYMRFSTRANNSDPSERMRIQSGGNVLIGQTNGSYGTAGHIFGAGGQAFHINPSDTVLLLNRQNNDGEIIRLSQDGATEGTISVSGSTVSYNGGHLARWSQLASGAARTEILRGSVLSNLDEMCEWGEEDNEQLNRMKVSDIEGDPNVSGVFQDWDDDDDTYINDFYCAMTGDFVIRIAQGTTVARGDLLMSAGDGTAKPQDDDIVRSKTIAKVTSTTVSTTYSDGSYCVPCVLMAC
jgi:hypothetical protein